MPQLISLAEVKKRLSEFVRTFKDAKSERSEASIFWTRFYECYGIKPETATVYEQQVSKLSGEIGRIDSFIPGKLIVEHKSKGKDLEQAYLQAQDYFLALSEVERPRYIITSDFAQFHLYDLRAKKGYRCTLADLPKHAAWFKFLIADDPGEITEETPINRDAAYAISRLHEELLRVNFKGRDLEIFLTRLLFCFFADDTQIFGENGQFLSLVEDTRIDGNDLGSRLTDLFGVLDKPVNERQRTLDERLAAFSYINGELFQERGDIPAFNSTLREHLLECATLDWSAISPAIFGAMFQGVLEEHDPDSKRQATRRELGAHYTSERNILRVVNPLFMDSLRTEREAARRNKPRLKALYDKLPQLTFLDPACGCGNFLVISYREIRRLENDVIEELFDFTHNRGLLDVSTLCRVRVNQFYGIEIDDAAAHIARVAMWITDHQLNEEAATRFGNTRPTIPLVDSPHIVCANALRIDWKSLLQPDKCAFILGNPPFVGKKEQSESQKAEVTSVFRGNIKSGVLDYVSAWYVKALEYILPNGVTSVAFVSTNSITQGEQVGALWGYLLKLGARIRFAHRTFKWSNEGKGVANVHCVIIGFSNKDVTSGVIFDYPDGASAEPIRIAVSKISPYLVEADNIVLTRATHSISNAPPMNYGSMPIDDGHLILTEDDYKTLALEVSDIETLARQYMGGEEFINGSRRYCLWLKDADPKVIRSSNFITNRIKLCRDFRLSSNRKTTQELAAYPMLFGEIRQPVGQYLLVPKVSSENRAYMPIGFVPDSIVASGSCLVVPSATLYHFGILTSQMHMAWMRSVCGRMKSDYQYSAGIVYNNLPWPADPTALQVAKVEEAAKQVLAARTAHSANTLAELYDPLAMPQDLLKSHQNMDKVVDSVYAYKGTKDDASRVAFLFKLYQKCTSLFQATNTKKRSRR